MRIIFMGTPDFAVGALEKIIEAGHDVCLVVTQPDKPKGRGKEMQFPPVKECALNHDIPVFQPVKIREESAVEELRKYQADMFVVAAFGQLLTEEILNMPKYGCINIHASLLPMYRGAAPIQWVIIRGEKETGITIMQMDKGLDTGDMLLKKVLPLDGTETGESLHDRLAVLGAEAIVEAIPMIEKGELQPEKQGDDNTFYAKMLTKALGHIDWSMTSEEIERLVRALNSWPSAYSSLHGKNVKIWEAYPEESNDASEAGKVIKVEKDAIYVKTGNGALKITELQLEGKKRMKVKDFLLGYKVVPGEDAFA